MKRFIKYLHQKKNVTNIKMLVSRSPFETLLTKKVTVKSFEWKDVWKNGNNFLRLSSHDLRITDDLHKRVTKSQGNSVTVLPYWLIHPVTRVQYFLVSIAMKLTIWNSVIIVETRFSGIFGHRDFCRFCKVFR